MTERQAERAARDAEMTNLRHAGVKIADIAEMYGCGTASVHRAINRTLNGNLSASEVARLLKQVELLQQTCEQQGRRLVQLEAYKIHAQEFHTEMDRLREENGILRAALKRATEEKNANK